MTNTLTRPPRHRGVLNPGRDTDLRNRPAVCTGTHCAKHAEPPAHHRDCLCDDCLRVWQ